MRWGGVRGDAVAGAPWAGEKLQRYLARFGYVEPGEDFIETFQAGRSAAALRRFQSFFGLSVTGELDEATRKLLSTRRCRVRDLPSPFEAKTASRDDPLCSWPKRTLLYRFLDDTPDIRGSAEFRQVEAAMKVWERLDRIRFEGASREVPHDIGIRWAPGGTRSGGELDEVIAEADYPGRCAEASRGPDRPLIFFDHVTWEVGAIPHAYDVKTVALHELGHILGLRHSCTWGSVMFPYFEDNDTKHRLHPEDKEIFLDLYPPA